MGDSGHAPDDAWSEPELLLRTCLQQAWREAGRPPPSVIRAEAFDLFTVSLAERTIAGWLKAETLPRSDTELLVLVQTLQAEQCHDWAKLLQEARSARKARLALKTRDAKSPPAATDLAVELPPVVEARPAAELPTVTSVPGPRHRHLPYWLAGAAVSMLVTLAFIAGRLSGDVSDRQCAIVTASPISAVFLDPERTPVKHKRFGERVELYTVLEQRESGGTTYQAVLVREGAITYGWMAVDEMQMADCAER